MPIVLALAVPFVVAMAVTLVSAPVVATLFERAGITDNPNYRKSHRRPVAYGGGVAMTLGLVSAVFAEQARRGLDIPWAALIGALVMAFVGFVDDVKPLSPVLRLAIQVVTGSGVAFAVSHGNLWWTLFGVIAMAGVVNVTNFMDGINGITGATATLWGITATYAGLLMNIETLVFLGIVTTGFALGFLPWNVFRPRMFPGDAGAYLLGGIYYAGMLPVAVTNWRHVALVGAPLSVYLVDTAQGIIRRVRQGHSPAEPHRDFVLHTIVDKGYRHITMTFVATATATLVTLSWALFPWPVSVVLSLILLTLYVLLPRLVPTRPGVLARRRATAEAAARAEQEERLAQAAADAAATPADQVGGATPTSLEPGEDRVPE